MTPNIAAFLAMIRYSENKHPPADPYRCTFQGELSPGFKKPMHIIKDLAYHPAEPRPPSGECEWVGESLAFLGPAYEHKISDAAGAFMLILPTWLRCKETLSLPDFYEPAQIDAAILLIKQRGALSLVNEGHIADAINLCHPIWASLPGSTAGQPTTSFAALIRSYGDAGGAFA